jgi:ubiquitin carboxyl-terminal hydrolase MINDY-1/2
MTRRTSLPYPTSPPPPPPFSAQTSEPQSGGLSLAGTGDSNFQNADNPWSDLSTQASRRNGALPDALRPGQPQTSPSPVPPTGTQSLANVPHALRAGHSQEDTPRSSLESDRSKDFWEDSDDGQDEGRKSPKKGQLALPDSDPTEDPWVSIEHTEDRSLGIKRKPVGLVTSRPDISQASSFASNNPFRQASSSLQDSDWGQHEPPTGSKGKGPDRDNDQPLTSQFQNLTFGAGPPLDLSLQHVPPAAQSSAAAWETGSPAARPPMPQAAPPPVPRLQEPFSPFSSQPPLIPVDSERGSSENPWASNSNLAAAPTPSPIPFSPSQKQVSSYNDDLLGRGQENGVVSLQDELSTLPNAARAENAMSANEPSLLDDEDGESRPPLPTRPAQRPNEQDYFTPPPGPPPQKPPRPTVHTTIPSDEEVARMVEQRNETYQIKHFNWFDHTSRKMRRSSMLTQNKNGPCPLLALVNALILGAKDESQAALDEALRTREQVTLGLIIETLMDELLSQGLESAGDVMPDVDELNHFLMRLRTGMNANPRFIPHSDPPPNLMDADDSILNMSQRPRAGHGLGTFEPTPDMKLYGAFQVPLVHGWLPNASSDAAKAFQRSAPTYEDAQALQFGEEELEYKLTHQGLSASEENMWQDINSIKNFLRTFPTQLTPTGLEAVQASIQAGSFAIMFRNDHFSTIYKHPESGMLFTLITDAGYADRDEIIWESLVDISGKNNEFFSGDFMPVSHNNPADESSTHPAARRTSQLLGPGTNAAAASSAPPMSPQEVQEQHDADFAMALQLQEEEEQRQRAERNRRRSSANPPGNPPQQPRRPQTSGNIPIPLRSNPTTQVQHQAPEIRPTIPPRNSHAPTPAVNRPADADAEDAPPVYEEAIKGRAYIPPLGSPLHPSSNPSPMASNTQLTGTMSNISQHSSTGVYDAQSSQHPPGPNAGMRNPRRRTSAYNEMQGYNSPQAGRLHPQSAVTAGPSGRNGRGREDRDCVVM